MPMSSQVSYTAVERFERTFLVLCREGMDINIYRSFAVLCINTSYQLLPESSHVWIYYFKLPFLQHVDVLSFAYIYAIKLHLSFYCNVLWASLWNRLSVIQILIKL